jgi:class 3 adenylate cyclase/tRNA A-37 threonylcarbamoyl transferase component Bud32
MASRDGSDRLPSGTVTFLFTDIEGSTALYESCPVEMDVAVVRHNEILAAAMEANEGYIFKTVGDAYCVAFNSARQAFMAALAAQRALFAEPWDPRCVIRVRMALHSGAATERGGDYFGPPVNRVARLMSAGHGGQILVSGAAYYLMRDHLVHVEPEAELRPLGEHRLRDLRYTEDIYQLVVPDLPADFPPIKTAGPVLPGKEDAGGRSGGDRYQIEYPIGGGGMAEVYLAYDQVLGRKVALKALRPQYASDEPFLERFRREAQSAASLSHSHIVPVHDWGETREGAYYIVMEYLPGGTLKGIIEREGPLEPERAARYTMQIARALDYAHQHGIIHRDIKPQNILITEGGEAKVADFGIARASSGASITQEGSVMGTAQYISPEQVRGEEATARSDLYSLGIVLYEMLTGEVPYKADTPAAIMMCHLRGDCSPPREVRPDIPEELNGITLRLLSKDPEKRYPSAAALITDLERMLDMRVSGDTIVESREELEREREVGDLTLIEQELEERERGGEDQKIEQQVQTPLPPPERGGRRGGVLVAGAFAAAVVLGGLIWTVFGPGGSSPGGGAGESTVPDLVGQTLEEARASAGGFEVVASESSPDPEDIVISQDPPSGAAAEPGSEISVSLGSSNQRLVTVPDLAGLTMEEARGRLNGSGLNLGNVREDPDAAAPAGQIVSQIPAAGSMSLPNQPVSVTVSRKP